MQLYLRKHWCWDISTHFHFGKTLDVTVVWITQNYQRPFLLQSYFSQLKNDFQCEFLSFSKLTINLFFWGWKWSSIQNIVSFVILSLYYNNYFLLLYIFLTSLCAENKLYSRGSVLNAASELGFEIAKKAKIELDR